LADEIIKHKFHDINFYFNQAGPQSQALVNEIFSDNYKVIESGITFSPNDVILDIGACEGMFSIMMAKLFPFTRVIALEPIPRTYHMMMRNIGLNACQNIDAYNIGGGKLTGKHPMFMCKNDVSGGGSAVMTFNPDQHEVIEVDVINMDDLWKREELDRVRLLKIDIEGLEYEVLYHSNVLPLVDYLVGEFHINARLDYDGYRMDGLANWIANRTNIIHIEFCKMAE
jgi:FkbM family methyltransferase